jgi:hypothetical protein
MACQNNVLPINHDDNYKSIFQNFIPDACRRKLMAYKISPENMKRPH